MARVKWPGSTSSPIGSIRQAGNKKRRLQATQKIPNADLLPNYSNRRELVSMHGPSPGSRDGSKDAPLGDSRADSNLDDAVDAGRRRDDCAVSVEGPSDAA